MKWTGFLILGLCLGCSGGGGSDTDAGQDAGRDAGEDAGADAGGDLDGGSIPDEDLGDDLALYIPAGTQACTINPVYETDLALSFETKGRVTFKEGYVRLPKEPGDYDRDWIESLEAGPSGSLAVPSGPGTFSLSMQGGSYNYLFSQNYQVDGQMVTLRFGVLFEPGEQVVTIGEETLSHARFGNFEIELPNDWRGHFSTCLYTFFHCVIREFQIEGGDLLKLEHCNYCPGDWICKADPGVMTRLLFTSGATERLVEDHFHLAHSMRHHNWGSDFLVSFEEPIGGIQAVHLGSDSYPDFNAFSEIYYLDENFALIETRSITQHEVKSEW